jgi:hypothetical protein
MWNVCVPCSKGHRAERNPIRAPVEFEKGMIVQCRTVADLPRIVAEPPPERPVVPELARPQVVLTGLGHLDFVLDEIRRVARRTAGGQPPPARELGLLFGVPVAGRPCVDGLRKVGLLELLRLPPHVRLLRGADRCAVEHPTEHPDDKSLHTMFPSMDSTKRLAGLTPSVFRFYRWRNECVTCQSEHSTLDFPVGAGSDNVTRAATVAKPALMPGAKRVDPIADVYCDILRMLPACPEDVYVCSYA